MFEDKVEAIKSLLPWIYAYRDSIPGAVRVQQYGEAEGAEGLPPAEPYYVGCNGRCHTCRAYHETLGRRPVCPPDEKWVREMRRIRRRYRIRAIEESIIRLGQEAPVWAQAVWAVWVEPWPGALLDPRRPELGAKTEPIGDAARTLRAELAEKGVRWLAEDIRGEVVGYGEGIRPPVRFEVRERNRQIVELRCEGRSYRQIARELRCSKTTVAAVLRGKELRQGREKEAR